jgi:hypothetical protein
MSGSPPPGDVLAPEGWAHDDGGEIAEGKPQSKGGAAYFMHSRELQAHDVLRTKVVQVGGSAIVGFATESYDVEKHGETHKSTAWVDLSNDTTRIGSDISRDGQHHTHLDHLKDYIPKTLPYDLALRISKDGNVPQIQFNDDAVWHDFAPDRAAVNAGPWFPFVLLNSANVRLSDHCVHRPKPTKSAGKTIKAPAAPAAAASADGAGAGAAAGKDEETVPPPQKKARHDEGGGSH